MCFRIQRWALKKDWSVQIDGQTVTASMYDLDVGPKPVDVIPAPPPAMFYAIPFGPVWAPYQIQAASNDALFPGEWTFDSDQEYIPMTDGSSQANLIVTGKLPVNEFSATGAGAPGIGAITQVATGGSLPAETTLYVTICAIDSSGLPSVPARIAIVGTGTLEGGTITLSGITWPAVSGLVSYVLFIGTQDDLICAQATGTLTAGAGNTYTPSSITFGGPLVRSTWALPSPYVAKVRMKAKPGINHGIVGLGVTSVSANTIVCTGLVGETIGAGATLVGRALSVIGRQTGSAPYFSCTISAVNWTTGALTVSPDPNGIVLAGDAVVIRNQADAPNTGTYTSITDSGYINSMENGGAGLVVNGVVGALIRAIAGTGRGTRPRKIMANTATSLTWDLPMQLDETSVWIIEGATWQFSADTTLIDNASPLTAASLTVPAANYTHQAMVIAGFTVDVNGNESPDGDAPIREDWIYGAPGSNASPGVTLQVDGTLAIGSNLAPIVALNASYTPQSVVAYVKTGPTGAGLTCNINVGGTLWMTLTIPAGAESVASTAAQLTAAGAIAGGVNITFDITAVGTTVPGADLSIFIYF